MHIFEVCDIYTSFLFPAPKAREIFFDPETAPAEAYSGKGVGVFLKKKLGPSLKNTLDAAAHHRHFFSGASASLRPRGPHKTLNGFCFGGGGSLTSTGCFLRRVPVFFKKKNAYPISGIGFRRSRFRGKKKLSRLRRRESKMTYKCHIPQKYAFFA